MKTAWPAVVCGLLVVGAWTCGAGPAHVEGEALVKYRGGVRAGLVRQRLRASGIDVRRDFRTLGRRRDRLYLHVRSAGRTTQELIALLAADPGVESVSPNYLRPLCRVPAPNDLRLAEQWGLHNLGNVINGVGGLAGADIDAIEAWALGRDTPGEVVVAVLDTGVDYGHPDLARSMWVNPGEIPGNNVDDDGNGYVDDVHGYDFSGDASGVPDSNPQDAGTHGTHVAGIAGATAGNGLGIAGVGRVRIMALKASTLGNSMEQAAIVEAVEYAIMMKTVYGVPVAAINMSFGAANSYDAAEHDAIVEAGNAGIIVVASAGNDGRDNDLTPFHPCSYTMSNLVGVAALDSSDALASFSNYGEVSVDLAAPGVNILSTVPSTGVSAASVSAGGSVFSAINMSYAGGTTGTTGTAYDCGRGNPDDFPVAVTGYVAVIERGDLFFSEKARNAMDAGAAAVVIYNNVAGPFGGTLQTPGVWAPVVSISQADGVALLAKGAVPATVVNVGGYAFQEGTSMAAPFVSGATAFLAAQFPGDSVARRVQRLFLAVELLLSLAGRASTGGRLNLARAMDADEDRLADWWEEDHFGDLASADGGDDADDDGFGDYAEFVAGTDPTNAASALAIEALAVSGAGVGIQWPSVTNRIYTLTRAVDAPTGFVSIAVNVAATPPRNAVLDETPPTGLPVFYRLLVE